MSKPTLVLTIGAWHTPACYDALRSHLSNYRTVSLHLPSVGPAPAVTSFDPDIATIRNACEAEFKLGNDVVVLAHSWSGIAVSCALVGFGKREREARGEKNGVVRIAYMAAFLLPEGGSIMGAIDNKVPEDWDVQNGTITLKEGKKDMFYNDLKPEDVKYWTSQLQPHALATFEASATGAAWREIPSSYLLAELDEAIPIASQEAMVKAAQDAGADLYTERCKSAHSPFLSMPAVVAVFLRRAAGESI